MNMTFAEWNTIKHSLEVAKREYEDIRKTCKESDDELSFYQIYTRQIAEAERLIAKIENAVI